MLGSIRGRMAMMLPRPLPAVISPAAQRTIVDGDNGDILRGLVAFFRYVCFTQDTISRYILV